MKNEKRFNLFNFIIRLSEKDMITDLAYYEMMKSGNPDLDKPPAKMHYSLEEMDALDRFTKAFDKNGYAGMEIAFAAYFADYDMSQVIKKIAGEYLKKEPLLANKENFNDLMLPSRYVMPSLRYTSVIMAVMLRCAMLGSKYSEKVILSLCKACYKDKYNIIKKLSKADFSAFMGVYGPECNDYLDLRTCRIGVGGKNEDEESDRLTRRFLSDVTVFYYTAKLLKKDVTDWKWDVISGMLYEEEESYYDFDAEDSVNYLMDNWIDQGRDEELYEEAPGESEILEDYEEEAADADDPTLSIVENCFMRVGDYYADEWTQVPTAKLFNDQAPYLIHRDLIKKTTDTVFKQIKRDLKLAGLSVDLNMLLNWKRNLNLADLSEVIYKYPEYENDEVNALVILMQCITQYLTDCFVEIYEDMRSIMYDSLGVPPTDLNKLEGKILEYSTLNKDIAKILTGTKVDKEHAIYADFDWIAKENFRIGLFMDEFHKLTPESPKQETKQGKSTPAVKTSTDEEIKALSEENEQLKSKIMMLEERLKRAQSQTERQRELYEDARKENEELAGQIEADNAKIENLLPYRDRYLKETKDTDERPLPSKEEMIRKISVMKVVIIGGHENWTKKVQAMFPEWKIVERHGSGTVAENIAAQADIVFFFSDSLAHRLYRKVMSVLKNSNVPYFYIHSINLDYLIEEIFEICEKMCRQRPPLDMV